MTREGRIAAGLAYGYRVSADKRGLNREIDPRKAAVVRRIFDDYAAGISPGAIAARLNADGIPSPSGRKWNDSTIRGNAKKRDGMLHNEAYVGTIVYGRNRFRRDSETGLRVSRPADTDDITEGEAPDLAIIADDVWNTVQDRLERTHEQYAGEGRALNGSHRARYLLNGLVKCGVCGGGFTIVAKDRYGCYRRKTQGKQECGNSRTISRQKLEARVLDRLRRGLMTPAYTAQFAAEVELLMKADRQDDGCHKAQLESRIAKAKAAIERLLDRMEGEEAGEALLSRLKTREAEIANLRAELTLLAEPSALIIPTQADLEAIYLKQVTRLEARLTGSDQMVSANALLREMLGEVRVQSDPDAQDGMRVELRGEASALFQAVDPTTKSALGGAFWSVC